MQSWPRDRRRAHGRVQRPITADKFSTELQKCSKAGPNNSSRKFLRPREFPNPKQSEKSFQQSIDGFGTRGGAISWQCLRVRQTQSLVRITTSRFLKPWESSALLRQKRIPY